MTTSKALGKTIKIEDPLYLKLLLKAFQEIDNGKLELEEFTEHVVHEISDIHIVQEGIDTTREFLERVMEEFKPDFRGLTKGETSNIVKAFCLDGALTGQEVNKLWEEDKIPSREIIIEQFGSLVNFQETTWPEWEFRPPGRKV